MPIKFTKSQVKLSGCCTVEEAENLFAWLHSNPKATVQMAGVEHLHAAVLQALMASGNPVSVVPADSFIAACLRQAQLPINGEQEK